MGNFKLFLIFSLAVYLSHAKGASLHDVTGETDTTIHAVEESTADQPDEEMTDNPAKIVEEMADADNKTANVEEMIETPAKNVEEMTGNPPVNMEEMSVGNEGNSSLDLGLDSVSTQSTCLTCGATLTTATGGIVYKPFETVSAHERCVWFIKPPSAKSFTLKVLRLGFPSGDDIRVHVTTFSLKSSINQYYLTSTTTYTYSNVQMIMVTFFTGSSTSSRNGFIMEYTSSTSGSVAVAYGNVVAYNNANNGFNMIRYPSSGNYGNNELTPIIFKPTNNVYSSSRPLNFAYVRNGLEGTSCLDSAKIFTFTTAATSSASSKWALRTTMCGNHEAIRYTGNDLVLILFESDTSTVSTGFHVVYNG